MFSCVQCDRQFYFIFLNILIFRNSNKAFFVYFLFFVKEFWERCVLNYFVLLNMSNFCFVSEIKFLSLLYLNKNVKYSTLKEIWAW